MSNSSEIIKIYSQDNYPIEAAAETVGMCIFDSGLLGLILQREDEKLHIALTVEGGRDVAATITRLCDAIEAGRYLPTLHS